MNVNLDDQYIVRPATMEDIEQAVTLFNTCSQAVTGTETDSVDDLRLAWQTSGLNLEQETRLVLTRTGEPVAYAELWDIRKPHVHKYGWSCVHPQYKGAGIGSALADWLEAKAREKAALAPEGARVSLTQGLPEEDKSAEEFLRARGYQYSRSFYRMVIDLTQKSPDPVLPEGIHIRCMQPGEERMVFHAVPEGFRDHWGFVEEPFEEMYARRMTELKNDPKFDASLWFLAMDGDQIAGFSLCASSIPEDPEMGWVNQLAVLRPWRKQGIALALLHHSFNVFYDRGYPRVGLGVDASSLTHAVALYERAGMRVAKKFNNFEMELRPGVELGTENL